MTDIEKENKIRQEIESKGYKIIDEDFDIKTKLKLICPNGHERQCSYNAFKKYNCRYCSNEKKLQELILSIEDKGYSFIKYPENARGIAIAECENGHIRETKIHNFSNFECNECVGKNVKKDIVFCKEVFESRGFILLEDEYKNCKTMMKYICTCGRERETSLDIIYNSKIDSCTECKGKKVSGKLAPNWRGGITPKNELLRRNSEYKNWRKAVFKRDEYTCQCCGEVGGKLRGHHVFSWHDNEHLRYDVDNGITLCDECHDIGKKDSFHSIYGAGNNTREQLDEFINNHNI